VSRPAAPIAAWQVVRYGRPTQALELRTIPRPEPGPREVLVRPAATVCNYNEVDGCHGRYLTVNPPLPYPLGMEFVGEVVDAGAGASEWIGRRVTGSGTGTPRMNPCHGATGISMRRWAPIAIASVRSSRIWWTNTTLPGSANR